MKSICPPYMSIPCFRRKIIFAFQHIRKYYSALSPRHASTLRKFPPPPFPVISSCPSPTCPCSATPPDLDIDRSNPLHGTIAPYAEQILIGTGRSDWSSRIEEDRDAVFVRQLKGLLGRGGKYSDPFHNVMLTHSSFSLERYCMEDATSASAYLFPSFRYISGISTQPEGTEAFVQAFVLPRMFHPAHDVLGQEERDRLPRKPELQSQFHGMRDVKEVVVLICGHGGRDKRCGIMGPLLQNEFETVLAKRGFQFISEVEDSSIKPVEESSTARVGLISHIGGHKFAGNAILYIPPSFADQSGKTSPLAGRGIWYGRVEPKHVDGIVRETILQGRVISELFRGVV